MSDNPLAGISIPSSHDIAERTVEMMGIATVDLANPLQRRRLITILEEYLSLALRFELERAIKATTERAVEHVFKVMRDIEYQDKKRNSRERRQKQQAEKREQKKIVAREARMDYSRRNLEVSKTTIQ
jgi:hypothetical protein